MTILFTLLGIALGGILIYFFTRSKNVENVQDEQAHQEEQENLTEEILSESLHGTEKSEETAEEMTKRLSKIKNPDQDKPFAKMSKPQISEIPDELLSEAPADIAKDIIEKPKKRKRPYKKKTPKKTEE